MAAAVAPSQKVSTTADLLAMPDDGIDRWLVNGRIVEIARNSEGHGMTIRNKHHALVQSRVSHLLESWIESQPEPRGSTLAGEAGVCLRPDPELTVGIDVVYLAPDVSARVMADRDSTIIVAVPTLAVEILSPSDTVENVQEKTDRYREVGIPQVWILDPHYRTVTIHRPGRPPVLLNEEQELDGGPELPGFQLPVRRLFSR